MTATTPSSSSHAQTRPNALAAQVTTGPPGPEVIAEALPFDTIPAEVLRDHFTKWLVEALAQTAALQAAANSATAKATTAERPQTVEPPKPKRPTAKNHPPGRKREGPLADAMEPPPPPTPDRSPPVPPPAPDKSPLLPAPARAPLGEPESGLRPGPMSTPLPSRRRPTRSRQQAGADPESPAPQPTRAEHAQVDAATGPIAPGAARPGHGRRDATDPGELRPAQAAQVPTDGISDWEAAPPPRPQYVRIGDKSVWLTKPMLRSRGWTEAAIRDFLPGPEALKPNPRFAVSGAPMPVWRPETVARAEADPKWRAWLERSLHRRQTTLEALAGTDDQEFRTRLELADQAIRDCAALPTLLDAVDHSAR